MAKLVAGRRWWMLLLLVLGVSLLVVPLQTRPSQGATVPGESLEQRVAALEAAVASLRSTIEAQTAESSALQETVSLQAAQLAPFSTRLTAPGQPDRGYEVYLTNANLHIVNGLGTTNGCPADSGSTDPSVTRTNGHGNLIIGYDEALAEGRDPSDRAGSHNLVVGAGHRYTSFGGLAAGRQNSISGPFACVTGGSENTASSLSAFVGGGRHNVAGGGFSSVSGGESNYAGGAWSSVTGGRSNVAGGGYSSVSGGESNVAHGGFSSVSGGQSREASDNHETR
jgi:hypothetical protein